MHRATPNSHNQAKIPFTTEGYTKLQSELKQQQALEKAALARLVTAREMGDLSENGAYKYAKLELGNARRRIRELSQLLKIATPTPKPTNPPAVVFGATVEVMTETQKSQTYIIVSTYEADPLNNKISPESPIGQALMNKRPGHQASFTTPQGLKHLTIVSVR